MKSVRIIKLGFTNLWKPKLKKDEINIGHIQVINAIYPLLLINCKYRDTSF